MFAQPLDELFAGHAGPWTEREWVADRIMISDIVVLDEPAPDAIIVEPDHVALVVEVTSPANAWVDRLVKPDAYGRAGIPYLVRVDRDRTSAELDETSYSLAAERFEVSARAAGSRLTLEKPFHVDVDLAALATATRYAGP